MPGSVASASESPSAGRGRRRVVALAVALLAVSAAVAWGVWGTWRGPVAQGEGAPAGARQGGEVPKASGTPGTAQAPAGGAEEWPGQSRGFVGPNGEGSYTKEDWSRLDEFEAWGRVYEPENELPPLWRVTTCAACS